MGTLPHSPLDYAEVATGVYRLRDSAQVYLIQTGRDAVAIDIGTGLVLDQLPPGIDRITDILVTHHHRSNVQGLARAAAAGARIWVPPVEQDLIASASSYWRSKDVANLYDIRLDRFTIADSVPTEGIVTLYRPMCFGNTAITPLPTPGHTAGSVSYLLTRDGERIVFSGDLIAAPGQIWQPAALMWSYAELEGAHASVYSCRELAELDPTLLLPSHGEPMPNPGPALAQLRDHLLALINSRREIPWTDDRWDDPFEQISPHLLRNASSEAMSYVLISDTGNALLIDYGYDMIAGLPILRDRSGRLVWLASIPKLLERYGVTRIEVAIPTHYHDDHVAAMPLLRDVYGTQIWAQDDIAEILTNPLRSDLPCLWYDPIPVDRRLTPGVPVRWHEYEITTFPFPGHTRFANAVGFTVDGNRVLATGDQHNCAYEPGVTGERLNFVYANRFDPHDFVRTAELYDSYHPDLLITGHWGAHRVTPEFLAHFRRSAQGLEQAHRNLTHPDGPGNASFFARIEPYRSRPTPGGELTLEIEVTNPGPAGAAAAVILTLPSAWKQPTQCVSAQVPGAASVRIPVAIAIPADAPAGRGILTADITVGSRRLGQQAEAIIEIGQP